MNKCLLMEMLSVIFVVATFLIRGHPFMTSTWRGEGSGSGGRMWTGESSPMWTSTQKIKIGVH